MTTKAIKATINKIIPSLGVEIKEIPEKGFTVKWLGVNPPLFEFAGYCPSLDICLKLDTDHYFINLNDNSRILFTHAFFGILKFYSAFSPIEEFDTALNAFEMNDDKGGLSQIAAHQNFWPDVKIASLPSTLCSLPKLKREKQGFIYVVELDGCIKVGFSSDWQRRIKQYKTGSLETVVLLVIKGTIAQELAFHRKYNQGKEKYFSSMKNFIIKEVKAMTNAEVIYDAMRRKGLTHDEALESL